ncbi:MAG: CRISPR-associated endonuclease Cas3'', partial [Thermoanaerobaculales bacterium]
MNPDKPIYMAYWGKAASEGETPAKHLLTFHLLDVAAVGRVLLSRHPTLLTRLSGLMGVPAGDLEPWLIWLLAHHDIGKFAAAFQRLRPELFADPVADRFRYDTRHDTLGYLLWEEKLLDEVFPNLAGQYELEEAVTTLLRTSAGHHGRPPEIVEWKTTWFRDEDVQAARILSRDLSRHFFGGDAPPALEFGPPGEFARRIAAASWPFAGFAVLCDWIGSNRLWFPFVDEPMPLEQYWERRAIPQAQRALVQAEIVPVLTATDSGFHTLFPGIAAPTELQKAAEMVPLADGPQLFFVEDLTGSGKTEAALTLTGRLLSAGKGEGVYVALPTTATADAMYDRVGAVYRKMFEPGTRPSLVLAHSRRDLSERFRTSVGGDRIEPEAAYGDGEQGAAATCAAWLADNRKKALLAQVGVGTIDQALLATLNVRHQSLRAFGLLGKVLVVDEVHACDAYMNRILEHL